MRLSLITGCARLTQVRNKLFHPVYKHRSYILDQAFWLADTTSAAFE